MQSSPTLTIPLLMSVFAAMPRGRVLVTENKNQDVLEGEAR